MDVFHRDIANFLLLMLEIEELFLQNRISKAPDLISPPLEPPRSLIELLRQACSHDSMYSKVLPFRNSFLRNQPEWILI